MPLNSSLEPILVALLTRFLRQRNATIDPVQIAGVAARCASLLAEHGVPAAVTSEAESEASRLSEVEVKSRAAIAAGPDANERLQEATKQLVKALFYPELAQCRLSFEAQTADGRCKRQERERARERLSGTHCVDCPHWAMEAEEHAAFLAAKWREGAEAFAANRAVFLPEDFRALRAWLRDGKRPETRD